MCSAQSVYFRTGVQVLLDADLAKEVAEDLHSQSAGQKANHMAELNYRLLVEDRTRRFASQAGESVASSALHACMCKQEGSRQ